MIKRGSKEAGSNADKESRSKSVDGKKKNSRAPKVKKSIRNNPTARTPEKEEKKEEKKEEGPKRSVRKKPKSASTTNSIENKTSDKADTSKGSLDKSSDEKEKQSLSKEDTSKNANTSREARTRREIERIRRRRLLELEDRIESDDKEKGKGFNMKLAQMFFKRMMESQNSTKSSKKKDENLEIMPDNSEIFLSKKVVKKKTRKHRPLDRNLFQENGDPFWVFRELKEPIITADGVKTRNPELLTLLEDDRIKVDDGKQWVGMMEDFGTGNFDDGIIVQNLDKLDPFSSMEDLTRRSKTFNRPNSVIYYTLSNLLLLNKEAIMRFARAEETTTTTTTMTARPRSVPEENEKTCVVTSIVFNMDGTFCISYDRRRPILSIQKFRKKYQARLRLSIERSKSREGSQENVPS